MWESGRLEGIRSSRWPIDGEKVIKESIDTGRVVTYRDHPDEFRLGPNRLENWAILSFKGRERPRGVLIAEMGDEDINDAISILVNHASILLDCLMLQDKLEDTPGPA